ncbi:MAG: hypothetical protein C5S46_02050 [Candidatus Methanomarinus sp.]|uniref:Uncharacterized protein n=1 Tax=Candidatus Methanomarinus sp. TaxID=3386244 RepID=A0AC61SCP5_9EURY|nr:MAG: hypothetical protein C5S41_08035 [ANME-2 cluster archaeon]KAF5425740.1 hypothetical protein C5S42_09770 [ANME-2 cluster archaeon]TKY92169.1 MAG: hypothetical protein C5S46_02050 [ANME-2 cluster archaeon]
MDENETKEDLKQSGEEKLIKEIVEESHADLESDQIKAANDRSQLKKESSLSFFQRIKVYFINNIPTSPLV